MKITKAGTRKTFGLSKRLLCFVFIFLTLTSTLIAALPEIAEAAPSVRIVQTDTVNAATAQVECRPVLHAPGTGYQSVMNSTAFSVAYPDAALEMYGKYSSGQPMIYITFEGVNSANNGQCLNSMLLMQGSDRSNTFYGVWRGTTKVGSAVGAESSYFQTATVNPAARTVNFTINQLTSSTKTFTVDFKTGAAAILDDPGYFVGADNGDGEGGGGGGNVSTGNCVIQGKANDTCLSTFTARFVDATTIKFAGDTYTNLNWGGDPMKYMLTDSSNPSRKAKNVGATSPPCTPYFELDTDPADNKGIDLNIDGSGGAGETQGFASALSNLKTTDKLKYVNYTTTCAASSGEATVYTLALNVFAKLYPSSNTIQLLFTSGGGNEKRYIGVYTKTNAGFEYALENAAYAGCDADKPKFVFGSDPTKVSSVTDPDGGSNVNIPVKTATWRLQNSNCEYIDASIRVAVAPANEAAPVVAPTGGSGTNPEDRPVTCESAAGALGWISCPVIKILDGIMNFIDTQIQALLEVNSDGLQDPKLKQTWGVIRNISYLVMIPIMLVMVLGTALGFEVFSAYTVKKALPRMIAAVIFISLSYYICVFLVQMFNAIGSGVIGLLTSPFDLGGGMTLATLFKIDGNVVETVGGAAVQIAGASAVLAALFGFIVAAGGSAIGIILMFFATAALFLFLAFLTLVIRQIFIFALILVAPLAILAWIFPGNDRMWKLWWGTFSKLLIMYPLIMGIIAMGRIFAYLIDGDFVGGDGFQTVLNPLLKLTAYILPYALIPLTFKFAGGIFANISGMVNDKGRGLFDRLKKGRSAGYASVNDKLMGDKNANGKRFGDGYRRVASFGRNGSFSMSEKGRERWKGYNRQHREHVADEMNEAGGGRAWNNDDFAALAGKLGAKEADVLAAYAKLMLDRGSKKGGADTEAEAMRMAKEELARTELAVGAKVGSEAMATSALKFRISMTNTAYKPGEEGLKEMRSEIKSLVDHGLITAVDAAGWMKSNRGRADYSANSFSDTIAFASGNATAADQLAGAFNGADPREIVGGHQRAVESFAQQAEINLKNALAGGDEPTINKALADVANIYDTMSNISPKKAQVWADGIYNMNTRRQRTVDIDIATGKERPASGGPVDPATTRRETRDVETLSVRQRIDEARSNEDFLNRRREYGSAAAAGQAGAAAEATKPPEVT